MDKQPLTEEAEELEDDIEINKPQKEPSQESKPKQTPAVVRFIYTALNPVKLISGDAQNKWFLCLIIPAFGWALFFFQLALDASLFGTLSPLLTLLICSAGFAAGYVITGVIGYLAAYILARFAISVKLQNAIALIALSHTYMIITHAIGFLYTIFDKSQVAKVFGIAGLLFTLIPVYMGLRSAGEKNTYFAPLFTTLIGAVTLGIWRLIMFIPL